jgi:hypothetical protein
MFFLLDLHFVSPSEKPMVPCLLRCQGFVVAYYGFMCDALDLEYSQLSLNYGITREFYAI